MLILRQSYHDDYVCILAWVAMLDGDEMDFSTRVCAVRRTWAPTATSHRVKQ
jgi:hypothetical protein